VGFVLLAIVVLVSVALAVWGLRSYEAELRRKPNGGDSIDPLTFTPVGDPSSSLDTQSQPSHHGEFGCGDSHHSGCDFGGHGGFDGGGHH
jgi:hypothetical protein